MSTKPWVGGPLELLRHGLQHLRLESAFDARIAMISIDNAVELMMKVYLGLPKRTTGLQISRAKYDELTKSFSALLDALEEYASERIVGLSLDEIEWFHRLRNELYHQGNGITVEKTKVEAYASVAKILMHSLFGVSTEALTMEALYGDSASTLILVFQFYDAWSNIEELVRHNYRKVGGGVPEDFEDDLYILLETVISGRHLPEKWLEDFGELSTFRYSLAFAQHAPSVAQFQMNLERARQLEAVLETILEM